VRGISKRRRKPADLTVEQVFLVLNLLPDPYYTMGLVVQGTCSPRVEFESAKTEWREAGYTPLGPTPSASVSIKGDELAGKQRV
jgi:hypothetical protein